MIQRSFFTAAILFALYSLWIFQEDEWHGVEAQGPLQSNTIRAQEYIYHANQFHMVIVGTSLSSVIKQQNLPEGSFNLALYGQSVYDALEIVKRKKAKHKTILIETNLLTRSLHREFVESLFQPVISPLRQYVWSLQEKNHPVIYSLQLLRDARAKPQPAHHAATFSSNADSGAEKPVTGAKGETDHAQESVDQAAMAAQGFRDFSQTPDPRLVQQKIGVMRQYILDFRATGAQVVLFEMPEDPQTCNSALTKGIQSAIRQLAAETHTPLLKMPDCAPYRTIDGVHLDEPSATRFANSLFHRLALMRKKAQPPIYSH